MSILTKRLAKAACRYSPPFSLNLIRPFTAQLQGILAAFSPPRSAFLHPSIPARIRPDTSAPQAFFLEEPDDEYNVNRVARSNVQVPAAHDETAVILSLLGRGEIKRALAVKQEFEDLGIALDHHRVFTETALTALDAHQPQDRMIGFLAWWPLANLQEYPEALTRAAKLVTTRPFDLSLLMKLVLISVKAGYMELVKGSRLVEYIFHYGDPNATTAFLLKLDGESTSKPAWVWELAVRTHASAGRTQIAKQLLTCAKQRDLAIDSSIAGPPETSIPEFQRSLFTLDQTTRSRPPSILATELRLIRRVLREQTVHPHFHVFLANFLMSYGRIRGKRVDHLMRTLRSRVFDGSASASAKSAWVAGEQRLYAELGKPLAVLRTLVYHCWVDAHLAAEANALLKPWRVLRREKDKARKARAKRQEREWEELDWWSSRGPSTDVEKRIWPAEVHLGMGWKAVLQLSKKSLEVERLYATFLSLAKASRSQAVSLSAGLLNSPSAETIERHMKADSDASQYAIYPPTALPTPRQFHHFVVAMAARVSPRRGAHVMQDMRSLPPVPHPGPALTPGIQSWGAVAGAYARAGDLVRTERVLDFIDASRDGRGVGVRTARLILELEASSDSSTSTSKAREQPEFRLRKRNKNRRRISLRPSPPVVAAYNSSLRGLAEAGLFASARKIEMRMRDLGLIPSSSSSSPSSASTTDVGTQQTISSSTPAMDHHTKRILRRLGRYERGGGDAWLKRGERRFWVVDGRRIYVDAGRAEWLVEQNKIASSHSRSWRLQARGSNTLSL